MASEDPKLSILAKLVAERLHAGQFRRDGEDYIRHCERVAAGVRELDFHARAVAYLHDVLEDTTCPRSFLELLFGRRLTADVVALTRGSDEAYAGYIERIVHGSDTALMVKLADVRDNLIGDPDGDLVDRYRRAERRLVEEAARRGLVSPPGRPD